MIDTLSNFDRVDAYIVCFSAIGVAILSFISLTVYWISFYDLLSLRSFIESVQEEDSEANHKFDHDAGWSFLWTSSACALIFMLVTGSLMHPLPLGAVFVFLFTVWKIIGIRIDRWRDDRTNNKEEDDS